MDFSQAPSRTLGTWLEMTTYSEVPLMIIDEMGRSASQILHGAGYIYNHPHGTVVAKCIPGVQDPVGQVCDLPLFNGKTQSCPTGRSG